LQAPAKPASRNTVRTNSVRFIRTPPSEKQIPRANASLGMTLQIY
jgi:hypothetical protein